MSVKATIERLRAAGVPDGAIPAVLELIEEREAEARRPRTSTERSRTHRERNADATKTLHSRPAHVASSSHERPADVARLSPDDDASRARSLCEEVNNIPPMNPSGSPPHAAAPPDKPAATNERRQRRAARLTSESQITAGMLDAARAAGLSRSQAIGHFDAMRDWSMSSPNGAKLDWDATYRGWLRRAAERPSARAGPERGGSYLQGLMDAMEQINDEQSSRESGPFLDLAPS